MLYVLCQLGIKEKSENFLLTIKKTTTKTLNDINNLKIFQLKLLSYLHEYTRTYLMQELSNELDVVENDGRGGFYILKEY